MEYNNPAFMCFIDLKKAFDRVQLKDLAHILYSRGIPYKLIKLIENIYRGKRIQTKVNREPTDSISVKNGIRQGDSFFNLIMDEIIR